MKIYFLRHGDAIPPTEWDGAEAERPLTAKGEKDIGRVGEKLAALGIEFGLVITSPFARALRSAELAVASMEKPPAISVDKRLKPGFGVDEFNALISDLADTPSVLLVGHEPDFSETISALSGGSRIDIKKGSLARLEIDPGEPRATLSLLIPPAFLR